MNKKQAALEVRRALQFFTATLAGDDKLMAVASVFPAYKPGMQYSEGEIFSFGENPVGDPQLFRVLQAHTSAAEWPPDAAPSLYKAVGITSDGIAIWVQPLGAADAYNTGDEVSHGGVIWSSTIDGNVWEPGIYGWETS